MRRFFGFSLAASVAISAGGLGAHAADMPATSSKYTPALVTAPVSVWNGWYVGLNAGGAWGHSNDPTNSPFCPGATCYFFANNAALVNSAGGAMSANPTGFTGGLQAGYNWQTGSFVAGIEADFEYFGQEASRSASGLYGAGAAPPFNVFNLNSSLQANWLFTLRPRVGVATGNWLFYGTGGLAVAQIKANWSFSDNCCRVDQSTTESASASSTKAGWAVGAGVEHALPGNYLIGVEYLYVKFNSVSAISNNLTSVPPPNYPGQTFFHSADLSSNIVRLRLSKLF